jgi:hypothetical protein
MAEPYCHPRLNLWTPSSLFKSLCVIILQVLDRFVQVFRR